MKTWFRRHFRRDMLRPTLYRGFSRLMLALLAALLWNEFVNRSGLLSLQGHAFLFLGIFFIAMAWMSYLRLDGLRVPQIDRRLFDWKRKPMRSYGDIADHVDEDVVQYEDLEEDEQTMCRLLANLACFLIFLALSFF